MSRSGAGEMVEDTQTEARRETGRGSARPRLWAAVSWTAGVLSVVLLTIENRLRVVHPASLLFLLLFVTVFAIAGVTLGRTLWRVARGRWRGASLRWTAAAIIPALLWAAWGAYGYSSFSHREIPRNLPMRLIEVAGASVMEARVVYLWPHRLETPRLVMFYDDAVTDPQGDAAAMDRHVARMEELTGLRLRSKIFYVRGPIFAQRHVAFRGLAFGSSQSPASYVDLHELAHAVIGQHEQPDSDPPTLLSEGWAESQSNSSAELADHALQQRQTIAQLSAYWKRITNAERQQFRETLVDPDGLVRLLDLAGTNDGHVPSWLAELTGPRWYHHDNGAVYVIGGAFVDHLLHRYGAGRFVQLYFACRPGTFEQECVRTLGVDLPTIEKQFWEDEEQFRQQVNRIPATRK